MLEDINEFEAGGLFACYHVKTLPALFFDGLSCWICCYATGRQAGIVPQL